MMQVGHVSQLYYLHKFNEFYPIQTPNFLHACHFAVAKSLPTISMMQSVAAKDKHPITVITFERCCITCGCWALSCSTHFKVNSEIAQITWMQGLIKLQQDVKKLQLMCIDVEHSNNGIFQKSGKHSSATPTGHPLPAIYATLSIDSECRAVAMPR